jgi:hypothetical protein
MLVGFCPSTSVAKYDAMQKLTAHRRIIALELLQTHHTLFSKMQLRTYYLDPWTDYVSKVCY